MLVTTSPIGDLLAKLDGVKSAGKDRWMVRCPAHHDRNPSLSIHDKGNKVLLHCFAGCRTEDVMTLLGLSMAELFVSKDHKHPYALEDAVEVYHYVDEQGEPLGLCNARFWPKAFRPFHFDSASRQWVMSEGDVDRLPYRLDRVITAAKEHKWLLVTEGERDVHALEAIGFVATCGHGGAKRWEERWATYFDGAKVCVVPDNDRAGIDYANAVADSVHDIADVIKVVSLPGLPSSGDVSDWIRQGGTAEQLKELVERAPEWEPSQGETEPQAAVEPGGDGIDQNTWHPVDLTAALTKADIEPPTMWERSDGQRFIYPARVHWFQGESESLKSWAAQIVVAEQVSAGAHVLYIDLEDDDRSVVARLLALGASPDDIAAHLIYVRPDEPMHPDDLAALLALHPYGLAVIDGVTEAMTLDQLSYLDNTDIATWMRALPKKIARTGAAVICIDHVTKATESQGRYAIGGQHKLAGTRNHGGGLQVPAGAPAQQTPGGRIGARARRREGGQGPARLRPQTHSRGQDRHPPDRGVRG